MVFFRRFDITVNFIYSISANVISVIQLMTNIIDAVLCFVSDIKNNNLIKVYIRVILLCVNL